MDIIAQERMRLFNAKTDEEREAAKASFVKALADGRELIAKFEEKTMACKGKRRK